MLASTDGKTSTSDFGGAVGRLCSVSQRGIVSLFRIKDEQSLQSCMLEWQASL